MLSPEESTSAAVCGGRSDAASTGARDAARRARSLLETYLPLAEDVGGGAALACRAGCGKDEGGGRYGWYSHRGRFTGGGAKDVSAVATGGEEGGSSSSSSEVAPPYAAERRSIGSRRSGGRPNLINDRPFFNRRNFDFRPSL